jgi:hypothetical protein
MYLQINGEHLVSEVQKNFTSLFPWLKIEFFKCGEQHPAFKTIPSSWQLREAWHLKKDKGLLKICDCMTVADLEHTFMEEFGLTVHVFRRSGNGWLRTTMTDRWTLHQQNDSGEEITRHMNEYLARIHVDIEL